MSDSGHGALDALRPLPSPAAGNAKSDEADVPIQADELIAADTAAGNFAGAFLPRLIDLTSHRVLAAASDPRAAA